MRKLKPKQLGRWCTFCPPKTTRAVYREEGWHGSFACEEHKDNLLKHEERTHDDHYTEADYQTWLR